MIANVCNFHPLDQTNDIQYGTSNTLKYKQSVSSFNSIFRECPEKKSESNEKAQITKEAKAHEPQDKEVKCILSSSYLCIYL